MGINRRDFFKIAGAGTLGALGIKKIANAITLTGNKKPARGTKIKRLAMVVDTRKCPEGCTDCIDACHSVHNVPETGDPKSELKWIWKESYEHAFPTQAHDYMKKKVKEKPLMVLCNHCEITRS